MVRFKVYDDTPEKKEKTVYFRLREDDGDIDLIACDEEGNRLINGTILFISAGGRLQLCTDVNPNIGLDLDEEGCIELDVK